MPDLNTTNDQVKPESMRSKIMKRIKNPSLVKQDINTGLDKGVESHRLDPATAAGLSAVSEVFLPDSLGEAALSVVPVGATFKVLNKLSKRIKNLEKSTIYLNDANAATRAGKTAGTQAVRGTHIDSLVSEAKDEIAKVYPEAERLAAEVGLSPEKYQYFLESAVREPNVIHKLLGQGDDEAVKRAFSSWEAVPEAQFVRHIRGLEESAAQSKLSDVLNKVD